MKKVTVGLICGIALAIVIKVWFEQTRTIEPREAPPAERNQPVSVPAQSTQQTKVPPLRVLAYQRTQPSASSLPSTLSSQIFTGHAQQAYQVAEEIPETLAQLPCYCHCDMNKGHKSLHSCFEDNHAEDCGICIGEALMAYGYQKREKLNIEQIREKIIAAYGSR